LEPLFKKYDVTDTNLWSKFKSGDTESFGLIYERYSDLLFKYGLSVVYDRELVKDSIQDLFVELWKQRQQIALVQSVKHYLIISVRRKVIHKDNLEKKRKFRLQFLKLESKENIIKPADEIIVQNETWLINKAIIEIGMKNLPPRQREAIFLRFYENLEYEEIGKIMGLNYQVIRNTIYRSLKSLRAKLQDKY
jgi:RNA polymerase sigma factor (sigma-70 family)